MPRIKVIRKSDGKKVGTYVPKKKQKVKVKKKESPTRLPKIKRVARKGTTRKKK